jgi:hypothetical protein
MKSRIRTFLAVSLLTITIWVWADMEQLNQDEIVVEDIEVLVPQSFEVESVTPTKLKVQVEGRHSEIQELSHGPERPEARFDLRDREINGESISLVAAEGFRHWTGVRVVQVLEGDTDRRLDQITVALDRLTEITVPVRVNVLGASATDARAVPPEVKATVSASELATLPEAKRYARATVEVGTMPPERRIDEEVALESRLGAADGIPARFTPARVRVQAALKAAVTPQTLQGVEIVFVVPPEKLEEYEVVFQDNSPPGPVDLTVEGRRELVEPLTARQVSLQVVVTPDDKPVEGAWIGRDPKVVGLPPGVTVVSGLPTVNFNLKRRTNP